MPQRGHFVPAPSLPPRVIPVLQDVVQAVPHPLPAQASVSSPALYAWKFPLYLLRVRVENHTGIELDVAPRAGADTGLPFPFSRLAASLPGTGRRHWAGSVFCRWGCGGQAESPGWREGLRGWSGGEGTPRTKAVSGSTRSQAGLILSRNENSTDLPCHVNDKQ